MGKIRPFELTVEKFNKVYNEQMRSDLLHVSDEAREPAPVFAGLLRVFDPSGPHEIYELGDSGVVVFRDIFRGYKCNLSFFVWDKGAWGAEIVREAKALIEEVASRHKLRKVETQTPDERVKKLATRMLGFELEGYRVNSFYRDGVSYGVNLLGRCFEN